MRSRRRAKHQIDDITIVHAAGGGIRCGPCDFGAGASGRAGRYSSDDESEENRQRPHRQTADGIAKAQLIPVRAFGTRTQARGDISAEPQCIDLRQRKPNCRRYGELPCGIRVEGVRGDCEKADRRPECQQQPGHCNRDEDTDEDTRPVDECRGALDNCRHRIRRGRLD